MSRVFRAPKAKAEFFREQRLRANRFQAPKLVEANGAKFLIAPNGMKLPLNVAVENELDCARDALLRAGQVTSVS